MDKALILDFETNGTDPAKDQVVEVALAMFSLELGKLTSAFSFLVRAPSNDAEKINGLPPAVLQRAGIEWLQACETIHRWMQRAEVVVAHNAEFDRSFVTPLDQQLRPWVCTLEDVAWPKADQVSGSRVTDLCLAHGIGVTKAHRALTDVMLLADLLERWHDNGADLPAEFCKAMRPKARYRAITGRYDPALNAKLKQHGFRWDPDRKEWWRRLPIADAQAMSETFPFKIQSTEGTMT